MRIGVLKGPAGLDEHFEPIDERVRDLAGYNCLILAITRIPWVACDHDLVKTRMVYREW